MRFGFSDYCDQVQRLIDVSINEAVDLVECMDEDSPEAEVENRTRAQYRKMIGDTAVDCFKRALDPEDYDTVTLPNTLILAIIDRVKVGVAFRAHVL
jgi:hypothetical protein